MKALPAPGGGLVGVGVDGAGHIRTVLAVRPRGRVEMS
jgi:hypothetical protein